MVRHTLLATAAVSLSLTATEASAHSAHQRHAYHHHRWHHTSYRHGPVHHYEHGFYGDNVAAARGRGLPWCGAEMADELGIHGRQGRELWLARNWAHVGNPTSARIGAVVVWPHHVGRIVGQENGQWVVRSGNDGGGVRSRTRSLAGAIAIRDVGGGFSFGGFAVASTDEQSHRYVHVSSIKQHRHYQRVARVEQHQRVARVEQRTPLWMHEETVQPDHFGAAAES
jgi:hypothetical protein